MNKLTIDTLYDKEDFLKRPKVSYKIREYIEGFFLNVVLREKKIIVNTKWNTLLQMSFFIDANEDYIISLPPSTYKNESIKAYPIMISYTSRIDKAKNINVEFAMILYEAVTEFLVTHFKKVSKEELEELKVKLDVNYLSSIIYPAPFNEQRFVGDDSITSETFYIGNH